MTTTPDKSVPPPETLDYRPREANNDWARPASRCGVASLLCLIGPVLLYLGVIRIGYLIWTTYPEERTQERIWPFALLIGMLSNAVGIVLGFAGIRRQERRIDAAIFGLAMNVIAIARLLLPTL
jgi:uncharacterized membrane protein HdeD (DUF308 family)